jgi:CBS domain-containing protein
VIVADIVRRSAPSVREHTVLTVAADALVESGLGSLPVLDADGLLTGVVSEGDLLRFVVGTRHEPAGSPGRSPAAYRQDAYRHVVADVMTRNPVTATEPLPVEEVARLFVRLPWRMLPVVRLGRLVGVVTRTDVVHALVGSDRLTGRAEPGRPPTFLATRLTGRFPS